MFETSGSIVIPEIGMTFTGFHDDNEADKAVTVFPLGRWDPWKDDFIPFSFKNAEVRQAQLRAWPAVW